MCSRSLGTHSATDENTVAQTEFVTVCGFSTPNRQLRLTWHKTAVPCFKRRCRNCGVGVCNDNPQDLRSCPLC